MLDPGLAGKKLVTEAIGPKNTIRFIRKTLPTMNKTENGKLENQCAAPMTMEETKLAHLHVTHTQTDVSQKTFG